MRLVAHVGDGPYVFGGLGLMYGLGWLFDNFLLRNVVIIVALIVLATMILVTAIKYGVRRKRPHPPGEFVTFEYDRYSFPSGHSARLAALASGTMIFYPLLGLALWSVALAVAIARVGVGVHYLSDIVAGLGVGVLVTWTTMFLLTSLSIPNI